MAITLVVEDGTGLATANAYITVAYADAYHLDRFNESWAGTEEKKESAILRATEYLDRVYLFQGSPINGDQALLWPRVDVATDDCVSLLSDEVPDPIERATAEAALAILCNGDPTESVQTSAPRTRRERVGVLEAEFLFDAPEGAITFPRVAEILAPYISSTRTGGGSSPIVRA